MPIVPPAHSPLFLPKASRNPSLPPASPHFFEKCHNAREARLKTMDVPQKTWDFFSETLDFFQKMSDIFSETSDFFLRCSEISLKGTHCPIFFAEMMNPYHPIHPPKSSLKRHSATSHRTGIFLSVFFFRLILQLSKSLLRAPKCGSTRTPFLLPS